MSINLKNPRTRALKHGIHRVRDRRGRRQRGHTTVISNGLEGSIRGRQHDARALPCAGRANHQNGRSGDRRSRCPARRPQVGRRPPRGGDRRASRPPRPRGHTCVRDSRHGGQGPAPVRRRSWPRCAKELGILTVASHQALPLRGRAPYAMAKYGIQELPTGSSTRCLIIRPRIFRVGNEKTTFAACSPWRPVCSIPASPEITDLMGQGASSTRFCRCAVGLREEGQGDDGARRARPRRKARA